MKIGKLTFKDYAAKKPVSVGPGGNFLTLKDVMASAGLRVGSLHALDEGVQLKLSLERYRLEPDFKLGIVGVGVLTKAEIIDQMKKKTPLGQKAVQVEMAYCNELIASLSGAKVASWPVVPKPPIFPKGPDWKPAGKCVIIRMRTRALFCENTTDGVTGPLAAYRMKYVHPVFQAAGFTLVVLKDTDDVRTNFIPQAKNGATVYISGTGHGNYGVYTGYMNSPILEVGQYDPAEVKDKALHFLSCMTAGQLGPDTVAKGAKCYAGYSESFYLVWDDAATPVNEFELFPKCDGMFDTFMACGATAQVAYDATIQAFNCAMDLVPNTAAASWLKYDRDHLKLSGAPSTKILPYRYVKICFPLATAEMENALMQAGEL